MADYKIPNLCGASVKFNAIQSKLDTMIDNAIDGLEVDASALKATMDTDVTSLVSDLKALVPELPALPDVNLQGQLTSLAGLAVGSGAHNTLLADVTSKFGSGLSAGGFSLDTLVSDAASAISGGTDLCAAVPNFSVPAAGGDAVQKAVEVLQAEEDSLPEKLSTLLANVNFTAAKTAVEETFTSYEEIGEEVPNEDIGPYRVTEETTDVGRASAAPAEAGQVNIQKVSTPKDTVTPKTTVVEKTEDEPSPPPVTKRKRANTVKGKSIGFSNRPQKVFEKFKEADITTSGKTHIINLTTTPYGEIYVTGMVMKLDPSRGIKRLYATAILHVSQGGKFYNKYMGETTEHDSYTISGKEITITEALYPYQADRLGFKFKVGYKYLDNFDPNFAGDTG